MMKIILVLLFVFCSAPVFAQVEELEARVGAVSCGTCFNVALLSLKELPGVSEVNGDIHEGRINISVKAGQGISIHEAAERVRMAGLGESMQLSIKARGKLEKRGNRMVLVVPKQEEVIVVNTGTHARLAASAASSQSAVSGAGKQFELKIDKLQKP
jgi:hypothetical protein